MPDLRQVLRFIGVSDVRFALIGPTVGPASRRASPARLRAVYWSIAADF